MMLILPGVWLLPDSVRLLVGRDSPAPEEKAA
jgi:hypothetical protein